MRVSVHAFGWSLPGRALVMALLVAGLLGCASSGRRGEWISLFDGETLAGWHRNPEPIGPDHGGLWRVENGVITGEQDPPGSGHGGILLSDLKFGDFELTIDAKPDWGVCSGIFLRCTERGQAFQVLVDYHDKGNIGHIHGERLGSFNNWPFNIYGVYDADEKLVGLTAQLVDPPPPEAYTISGADWLKAWKFNDWNSIRVRIVGTPARITTWLNGAKVSEFDAATYVQSRYDREKVIGVLGDSGSIGLQVHSGPHWPEGLKCRWKNIRVRSLRKADL